MEIITKPTKQLPKHALPLTMLIMGLMALSAMTALGSGELSNQTETLAFRDLTARVVHIHPDTNGLAKITLGGSVTPLPKLSAGTALNNNLVQTGSEAQLSIQLKTPKTH